MGDMRWYLFAICFYLYLFLLVIGLFVPLSQRYKTSCKIAFSGCFLRVSRKSESINEILYLQAGTSMYVIVQSSFMFRDT